MNLICFGLTFVCLASFASCNIHRALPGTIVHGNVKNGLKSGILKSDGLIDFEEEDELPAGFLDRIYQKANVAWLYAIPAAVIVGCTGIFPLLIFKVDEGHELKEAISPANLKLLLSFAVGGLLGDVFLHLLPESWMYLNRGGHDHIGGLKIGGWVLAGLLCFLIIEKIFFEEEKLKEELEKLETKKLSEVPDSKHKYPRNGEKNGMNGTINGEKNGMNGTINGKKNGMNGHANGVTNSHLDSSTSDLLRNRKSSENVQNGEAKISHPNIEPGDEDEKTITEDHIKVIGYLNLLANCIDNFTHGLAVAGSFIVSVPVGICTTFAILLHEIPHEIGDFAILLKAGFNRWEAAKGQLLTASGALFGCIFGLVAESAGDSSAWVLPFTSGGFIYIALVTVVPDLLKEEDLKESLKQIAMLLTGLSCMAMVSLLHH